MIPTFLMFEPGRVGGQIKNPGSSNYPGPMGPESPKGIILMSCNKLKKTLFCYFVITGLSFCGAVFTLPVFALAALGQRYFAEIMAAFVFTVRLK